jgi:hypothetical protein
LEFEADTLKNKEVIENKQHFFHEKFKNFNADNIGARIMNIATYDVGDDKKHKFGV